MNSFEMRKYWLGYHIDICTLSFDKRYKIFRYFVDNAEDDYELEEIIDENLIRKIRILFSDSEIATILNREVTVIDDQLISSITDETVRNKYESDRDFLISQREKMSSDCSERKPLFITSSYIFNSLRTPYGAIRYIALKEEYKVEITSLDIIYATPKIDEEDFVFGMLLEYQKEVNYSLFESLRKFDCDKKKLILFKESTSRDLKLAIALSLHSSKNVIRCIVSFEGDTEALEVIATHGDDSVKLAVLRVIEENKRGLIASKLKSHEARSEALQFIDSTKAKIYFVRDVRDDVLKAKFLLESDIDVDAKGSILETIENRILKQNFAKLFWSIEGSEILAGDYNKKYDIYDALEDSLPGDLGYGIEIELSGKAAPYIRAYQNKILGYDVKVEDSVNRGIEFTSDILHFNRPDLRRIYEICDFAERNGLSATEDCGLHIHYSAKFLDNYFAWLIFFYIYCNLERAFFLIANEPNTIPREGIYNYSPPISNKFSLYLSRILEVSTKEDLIGEIQTFCEGERMSINLKNIGGRFDTIEVRIPNGTANPAVIVQNILLFGRLITLAERLSRLPLNRDSYDFLKSFDAAKDEEERLELFLKVAFSNEINRNVYRERYIKNKPLDDVLSDLSFEDVSLKDIKVHI